LTDVTSYVEDFFSNEGNYMFIHSEVSNMNLALIKFVPTCLLAQRSWTGNERQSTYTEVLYFLSNFPSSQVCYPGWAFFGHWPNFFQWPKKL